MESLATVPESGDPFPEDFQMDESYGRVNYRGKRGGRGRSVSSRRHEVLAAYGSGPSLPFFKSATQQNKNYCEGPMKDDMHI